VTASADGTARLWNLSGEELAVLEGHTDWVWSAAFSPDGERLLTASDDGTARLWPSYLSLESKIAVARQRLLDRHFIGDECRRFFRDDPVTCPQTVEALFALFDGAES
jgi:WD40 repeat protein